MKHVGLLNKGEVTVLKRKNERLRKHILFVAVCTFCCVLCTMISVPTAAVSEKNDITDVSVIGVVAAEIGKSPTVSEISVPQSANYEIESKSWRNNTDFTENFDTFEDRHRYTLTIVVKPKDGYKFGNSPTLTVNGNDAYGKYQMNFGEKIYIILSYSFLKEIDKIELPAFPESVPVGEVVPPSGEVLDMIVTAEYSVKSYWMTKYYTSDKYCIVGEATDTFLNDRFYAYEYYIGVKPGYEITDNTIITVGGSKPNGTHDCISYDRAMIYKIYDQNAFIPIHRVNITVLKPVVGQAIKNDTFTLLGDRGVEMREFVWEASVNPRLVVPEELGNQQLSHAPAVGNFEAGKYYSIKGRLVAQKGYYFAEDLVVTVNGAEVDRNVIYADGPFGMGSSLGYFIFDNTFDKLEKHQEKPQTASSKSTVTQIASSSYVSGSESAIETLSDTPADNSAVETSSSSQEASLQDDTALNLEQETGGGSSGLVVAIVAIAACVLAGGGTAGYYFFIKKK